MLDSTTVIEAEVRNPRIPEIAGHAPGPQILEVETVEAILEMYAQNPTAEVEGWSRPMAELEGRSRYMGAYDV